MTRVLISLVNRIVERILYKQEIFVSLGSPADQNLDLFYIQRVSIHMGPKWLPNYFYSLGICTYTRCLNIYGTHVTALLFLLSRDMYIYKVSQYTLDPCDCPIISTPTGYVYIQGVSIYIGPMCLPYYFCSLSKFIYKECLHIHSPHMTANNSTTNNINGLHQFWDPLYLEVQYFWYIYSSNRRYIIISLSLPLSLSLSLSLSHTHTHTHTYIYIYIYIYIYSLFQT